MARKNSMKLRIKKHQAKVERGAKQEQRLESRRANREESRKNQVEVEVPEGQLKRKTMRRLENERARLARKGIKLVKMDDVEDEPKRNKRMRPTPKED
ncbi:hypothetical protein BASA81_009844 [Batrachochytrium salamandrivorans]|nr:hypothetical protein BASA81_009844 [Batrachochytrium salamandrivorans]